MPRTNYEIVCAEKILRLKRLTRRVKRGFI